MHAGMRNGGYIFNSEEGIPYQTPEENVRIMMQTAKQCGCAAGEQEGEASDCRVGDET